MIQNVVIPLLGLTALYGVIILALIWVLRRLGVSGRWAILLGFLLFGLATGFMVAWLWPLDSSVYPNVWAALLGDALYRLSVDYLGDLWPLQVPRVYVICAALLYGGCGLLVRWIWNRGRT